MFKRKAEFAAHHDAALRRSFSLSVRFLGFCFDTRPFFQVDRALNSSSTSLQYAQTHRIRKPCGHQRLVDHPPENLDASLTVAGWLSDIQSLTMNAAKMGRARVRADRILPELV